MPSNRNTVQYIVFVALENAVQDGVLRNKENFDDGTTASTLPFTALYF
jgi:hypothetical protein